MTTKYPTPAEIINKPLRHRSAAIATIRDWKENYSSHRGYPQIKQLIHKLAKVYKTQVTVFRSASGYDCYLPGSKMICTSGDSIITALHEFAHHLYGPSESIACRWSIWLYAKAFPEELKSLTWKGHMLIKETYANKKPCFVPDNRTRPTPGITNTGKS